jgi:translation elongation factor EF-4
MPRLTACVVGAQGKKRQKMVGKVSLSQEAFWAVVSKT